VKFSEHSYQSSDSYQIIVIVLIGQMILKEHFTRVHSDKILLSFHLINIKSNSQFSSYKRLISNSPFHQQHFNSNFISTTMLDIGRGARTTSIKTLSTLIPHVMCQSCNEINVLVLQNKSIRVIQLK
jgi:hypothetical protein